MSQNRRSAANKPPSALKLRDLKLSPITMVRGPSATIADRALAHLRQSALASDPDRELTEVSASQYLPGQLQAWSSPSLFGNGRIIQINEVDAASDDLVADLIDYFDDPEPDVVLLLHHRGGNRGKKLADAAKKAGATYSAEHPKKRADRLELIADEAAYRRGTVPNDAAQKLVDAVGDDADELLGTIRQLLDDNGGTVSAEAVSAYYAGRIDTTGFEVADAVADGEGPRAVLLARRATQSGVVPILLVSAIAQKLRDIAKVMVPGVSRAELGMPPWQVDRARRSARGWTPEALGAAIILVAKADEDVKGASRDPVGAVERCIIEISRIRARRR